MGTMGLSCGSQFAKYFLFIFNIIFWIVGAAIMGIGIYCLVDPHALDFILIATVDSSDQLVRGAAITFVVIGVVVFVTGFLGCCGAIKESPVMLTMYASIVGFVLFLQVVAGILGAVFKGKIEGELDQSMNKSVSILYGDSKNGGLTNAYDFMQREMECCGALNGPIDWTTSEWKKTNKTLNVPLSCCVLKNQKKFDEIPKPEDLVKCQADALKNTTSKYVWTRGCKDQLHNWVDDHAILLIGIAFGLAFVQVIGVVIACCLKNSIRKQYEYV